MNIVSEVNNNKWYEIDKDEVSVELIEVRDRRLFGDILDELDIPVLRSEWRSKYNSYVAYDYEPFCSDGFFNRLILSNTSRSLFAIWLMFNQYLEPRDRFERAPITLKEDGIRICRR